MSSISSIGLALPPYRYTSEDVKQAGIKWLQDNPNQQVLFERFLRSSSTEERNYALTLEEILSLKGSAQRYKIYAERAAPLAQESLYKSLELSGVKASDIEHLVFTSCSVPALPSIDALLIDTIGLRRNVHRVPIYQQGCAGGVVGLSLAARLLNSNHTYAAVVSVELCSLVFHLNDASASQLVGAAIFADGAASLILSPLEKGLTYLASSSFLAPNTRHLLGYDIYDDGAHLRLESDLPNAVAKSFPIAVDSFLSSLNLSRKDISWWLFHPGGVKVMNALEQSLEIASETSHWGRDVLYKNGNLSSATILFVIKEFIDSKVYAKGDYVLVAAIGPGITVELVLMQVR